MKDSIRVKCFDYIAKNLEPGSVHETDYSCLHWYKEMSNLKFLPCIKKEVLVCDNLQCEVHSPYSCYSDQACMTMGFPVLNPDLEKKNGQVHGTHFQCELQP